MCDVTGVEADEAPQPGRAVDTLCARFVSLWKAPRAAIRDLVYSAILPEPDFKRLFAAKFGQVR